MNLQLACEDEIGGAAEERVPLGAADRGQVQRLGFPSSDSLL